jgi:hypothetical protein
MPKTPRPLPWRGRALLREHARAAAAASVRPARDERVDLDGPDPIRVLLLGGGGLAVGHGARTRAEAVDGRLAERLAERTGRGVIVDNVADERLRLADQVLSAFIGVGFELEDVVVWCPSAVELTERPWMPWSLRLRALLDVVPSDRLLVIRELPVPEGADVASAAPVVERSNAALRRAVEGRPNTVVVTPPPIRVRPLGEPRLDAAYHEATAERIAEVALEFLEREAALLRTVVR